MQEVSIPITSGHKRIPVHIISGFLGAGKTTFLNEIIRERLPERIIVIENEVGDTNIDGALVMEGTEDVLELTAGCICCSLSDDLAEVLYDLARRRHEYDRLIIETTGIADPAAVMQAFLGNLEMEQYFQFINVICLADARHIEDALRDTDEARRQLVIADVMLLHKTDLVQAEEVERLTAVLKGINPMAEVFAGARGKFPVAELLQISTTELDGAVRQSARVDSHHKHQHHDIVSFTLTFDREFEMRELHYELTKLLHLYQHQVYRVKGIIAAENCPVKVVVQSVREMLDFSDGTPWRADEVRQSKIVFIGKGVNREIIEKIFTRCLQKPVELPVSAERTMAKRVNTPILKPKF